MMFRRHKDADEWTLVANNGCDTPITIANLAQTGSGSWCTGTTTPGGPQTTFAEAKRIALECSEGR